MERPGPEGGANMETISADGISAIAASAEKYLVDNVGDATAAGLPVYDAKDGYWRVPAMVSTTFGLLKAGEVLVGENNKILAATSPADMESTIQTMCERLGAIQIPPVEVKVRKSRDTNIRRPRRPPAKVSSIPV